MGGTFLDGRSPNRGGFSVVSFASLLFARLENGSMLGFELSSNFTKFNKASF